MIQEDQSKDKLIDLELAKNDHNDSPIRRYVPAVVLAASFYYSFLLSLGLILGYLASKVFSMYLLEKGKVDSIYLDYGTWKVHFHHWIMGGLALFFIWFTAIFHLSHFTVGLILGVMAHDIYDFNDWHKVLVKKENV